MTTICHYYHICYHHISASNNVLDKFFFHLHFHKSNETNKKTEHFMIVLYKITNYDAIVMTVMLMTDCNDIFGLEF